MRKKGHLDLRSLINSDEHVTASQIAWGVELAMDQFDRLTIGLQEYQKQLILVGRILKQNPKINFNLPVLEIAKNEIEKYAPQVLKRFN